MLATLLASLASGETMVAIRRARRAAIVYSVAGLLVLCGVGFLIGALYIWLADHYGRLETALGFGVGFLVLALLIVLINRLTANSRAKRAAERRKSDLTALGVATALAVLPNLLRSRAGIGSLLAPAIAIAAYAIWRENTKPSGPDPDQPPD
jgi:undecaprenyl pyrophosphate phosphatase UppP